ncbi:MAG: TRAP transporter small permease [Synergistales bacterium]|nr:TRAP transporter small permease [Synergistales bacterium]
MTGKQELVPAPIRGLRRLSRYSVIAGGVVLLCMSFFIAFEVVLRKFFSLSTRGAEEISSYALAAISAWAFAFALFEKAHIRIDVLYTKLQRGKRFFLDLLALFSVLFFLYPMLWYAFKVVRTSIARNSVANTPLQTPLWIPQSIWFAGLVFFAFVATVLFLATACNIVRGRYETAATLSACTMLEEDIAREGEMPLETEQSGEPLPNEEEER